MHHADWAVKEARLRADLAVMENEYKICAAKVEKLVAQSKKKNDAQVKAAKEAMHRADLAVKEIEFKIEEAKLRADLVVKEIKYEICAAKVEMLVAQSKKKNDAQVNEAKAARDDAREERNKASARLDEFTKSQGTAISPSPT